MGATAQLATWRLTAGAVRDACALLGDAARWKMLHPSSTGWALSAQLKSEGSVDAQQFAEWWCGESLGAALHEFVLGAFAGAELAERHGEFFRYKLAGSSGGGRLSQVFAAIEGRRAALHVQEYSLSQVDLESVFNLLASQQEEERGVARGVGGGGGGSAKPAAGGGGGAKGSINAAATPPPKATARSLWQNLGLAPSASAASPGIGLALLETVVSTGPSSASYESLND